MRDKQSSQREEWHVGVTVTNTQPYMYVMLVDHTINYSTAVEQRQQYRQFSRQFLLVATHPMVAHRM